MHYYCFAFCINSFAELLLGDVAGSTPDIIPLRMQQLAYAYL